MLKKTVQYGIKCKICNDEIFSNHRHDFVECKCKAVFVDGGFDYLRYGGDPKHIEQIQRVLEKEKSLPPNWS